MRRSITLFLVAAAVGGCAPTGGAVPGPRMAGPDGSARQCFQADRIINFTRGESQQLYVKVLGGGVFSLRTGGCPDAGSANALVISPATGIGGQVCVGDNVQVTQPGSNYGPAQCLARVDQSLSPPEVEALPSRYRP